MLNSRLKDCVTEDTKSFFDKIKLDRFDHDNAISKMNI